MINRTVAWLLLIRSTKGYEDLIEDVVQAGEKNFLAAYKNIYFEFNRVTTSNLNALCVDLYQATMEGTQLNVRSFAASTREEVAEDRRAGSRQWIQRAAAAGGLHEGAAYGVQGAGAASILQETGEPEGGCGYHKRFRSGQ